MDQLHKSIFCNLCEFWLESKNYFRSAKSSEQWQILLDGAERRMDPGPMGRIYMVLAFAKETSDVKCEPVGFENKKLILYLLKNKISVAKKKYVSS